MIFALLAQYHAAIPHLFSYRLATSSSGGSGSGSGSGSSSETRTGTRTETETHQQQHDTNENNTQNQNNNDNDDNSKSLTIVLSDKATTYLVAAQLALSQFPGMLLPAIIGWVVGLAWRAEILPGVAAASSSSAWRVPAWMVGEKERVLPVGSSSSAAATPTYGMTADYDDLRRRLDDEAAAAAASGQGQTQGLYQRRRRAGGFLDRLRGAF